MKHCEHNDLSVMMRKIDNFSMVGFMEYLFMTKSFRYGTKPVIVQQYVEITT